MQNKLDLPALDLTGPLSLRRLNAHHDLMRITLGLDTRDGKRASLVGPRRPVVVIDQTFRRKLEGRPEMHLDGIETQIVRDVLRRRGQHRQQRAAAHQQRQTIQRRGTRSVDLAAALESVAIDPRPTRFSSTYACRVDSTRNRNAALLCRNVHREE